jgi:hypothetical protein
MAGRLVRSLVVAVGVAVSSCVAWSAEASAASGYYVTFAARDCLTYGDIYANKARNDIVESLEDLGPNTQYGNSGAVVSPAYEDLAPQTNCRPLPNWTFTLGTGYVTRAVTGQWGSLSKVTGPYSTSIVTRSSTALLDNRGDPVGSQTVPGAVTVKLTDAQAAQASKSSSLWVQGGAPNDPVLASQYGSPQAPDYGFGTLRCAIDNVNGDNVEYVFFPSGTNHIFCYAYYVSPPATSGTVVIRKQVVGAPAGANPAFPFKGDLSFDPNGFTLKNGQATTFYRAGGQAWSVTEGSVAGYSLNSVNCTATAGGGGPGTSTTRTSGGTLSVNLAAGETVDCTFVNRWAPPTGDLTIAKVTDGDAGGPFDFLVAAGADDHGTIVSATTSQAGVPVNAGPESSLADLAPGTYTITETGPVNPAGAWNLVGVQCNGVPRDTRDVSVTITAGSRTVCTFTNRLVPAGAIILSKVTEGGTGTAAFGIESTDGEIVAYHQDVTTKTPGVAVDAAPDTAADATDHIPLGAYRIVEQPPLSTISGSWILTSVACDGVDMPFSQGAFLATLNRGHPHAACRFTNTLTHGRPGDPEATEPGEPSPPTSEPDGSTTPEGTTAEPGNVWADISVSSTPRPRLVPSAGRIADTVVVSNHGPSDAEGVILDYQAPKGTKLISVHTPTGTCSRELPLTCQLGIMKPRQKVTLTVAMVPARRPGVFAMHAALGSGDYDPVLSNNSGNERVYIERGPPTPPRNPVACPSRVRPIARAAC